MQDGARSASGRAAKTDEDLLSLDQRRPVPVVVKLDYDSLAAYTGDIEGLPATSPSVTGQRARPRLGRLPGVPGYAAGVESTFIDALDAAIPAADVGESLRMLYGGIAVKVPGNKSPTLAKLPGVAAVQANDLRQPLTDSSPDFIGAPPVYPQLGGIGSAGRRASIVGVLDTRRLAGARLLRRPRQPARPAAHGRRHAPGLQLRRQPADPGQRPVRVQQQADRRPAVPRHLHRHRRRRGVPRHRPRLQRPRHPHRRPPRPAGRWPTPRCSASTAGAIHGIAPAAPSRSTRCAASGAASTPTPWRPSQQAILDGVDVINFSISRRHRPLRRPGRAGLPRRLRGGHVRRRLGGQRRARRRHGQPHQPLGHHGGRLDPGAGLPSTRHADGAAAPPPR